jgi:MacB-like periplasmic core domain
MNLREFFSRIRGLFREQTLDRQLEEEVRFHLDMEAEKNRSRGMNAEDARAASRRAFGGAEQIKEVYREQRGLPMIEIALKDLRCALRGLRRSPGFAAIVVTSLALAIGANTAIFTLIYAVMLQSLPVRSPDELVSVGDASRPTAFLTGGPMANIFSYPLSQRLRNENQVFTGLLASGKAGRIDVATANGAPEESHGRLVSDNYFEVLGVSPVVGRGFSSRDDQKAGADSLVVISYDYWVNRFGRSSDILVSCPNGSCDKLIGVRIESTLCIASDTG